tara:strand:+ start:2919 stop:3482 length:564 start_codon:yes stop_codon:yes gene_type:complete
MAYYLKKFKIMSKILAFGASSSKKSINKKLAVYVAKSIPKSDVNVIDLNDYEMPIYSVDRENEGGIPDMAYKFREQFKNSDAIVISFAEHNASYTSAFKNIFDWISRIDKNIWFNKPMFLLATSTGSNGASIVLEVAFSRISRGNTNHISTFSLPNFNDNFNENMGITNSKLKVIFESKLNEFISKM